MAFRGFSVALLGSLVAGSMVLGGGVTLATNPPTSGDSPVPSRATAATSGDRDGADPYLAPSGNGGIDVQHYNLRLRYAPQSHGIAKARVRLNITALHGLDSFSLDAREGLRISQVRVSGRDAKYRRNGRNVVISGFPEIASVDTFKVVLR